jgi:hypothetical protein
MLSTKKKENEDDNIKVKDIKTKTYILVSAQLYLYKGVRVRTAHDLSLSF